MTLTYHPTNSLLAVPFDDTEEQVICPEIMIECLDGSQPVDCDGDGCRLECGPCEGTVMYI